MFPINVMDGKFLEVHKLDVPNKLDVRYFLKIINRNFGKI